MVDLSQDQPLKEKSKPDASVSPTSDQSPITQPATSPKKPDEAPSLPIKDEEKIATPEQEEIKKELSELGIPPEGRGKKTRVLLAALGVLFLIATLPAAVYLVKQRQKLKIEAIGYGDQAHSDYELTIGPEYLDYVAKGYGTQKNSSPTISLNIPAGSTIYKAHAVWGGERDSGTPQDTTITISVNGGAVQAVTPNLASWDHLNTNYNTYQNSYLADITSLLPADTTNFTFSIGSFLENYINDGKGGTGHGISIIIVYKNSANLYREIKIKLWGEYIRANTSAEMVFNFTDIDTSQSSELKTVLFAGEGEGTEDNKPRPNFLFYNGNQLNPTDGSPYFAYSKDDGHWWDTRITGGNLPTISASGTTAKFWVVSNDEKANPAGGVGDSLVLHGGMMAYAVTPPTEVLTCTSLTSPSAPSLLSPGAVISLTCKGTSDLNPINHFEFRVSSDSGTPVELPPVPATKTDGEYEGETTYEIPDYGCYQVECRACTSSDSTECTVWGQAQ